MGQLNIKNRTIFCLDNLQVMKRINSDCIDLIYLDPPFSKNDTWRASNRKKIDEIGEWFKNHQKELHFKNVNFDEIFQNVSYRDIWTQDDIKDVHFANLAKNRPQLAEFLSSVQLTNKTKFYYLVFMAVRLLECHRILKDTGSLYLHCDPEMSHHLKLLLDRIFGEGNFRNEIIWGYSQGGKSKKSFGRKHDVIFLYTKSDQYKFNPKAVKIPMLSGDKSFGGRLETDQSGRKYRLVYGTKDKEEKAKYYKYYLDEGKIPEDYWVDINSLQSGSKERIGYPTQKPLALLDRIIKASSDEGDIVLDPFCGCATTCVAAEQLNRQWVGIDINPQAYYLNLYRMYEREGLELEGSDLNNGKLYSGGRFHAIINDKDLPDRDDISESDLKEQQRQIQQEAAIRRQWQQKQATQEAKLSYERNKDIYKELLYNDQNGFCAGCGEYKRFNDLTIDHIVPKTENASLIEGEARISLIHGKDNLHLMCHRDNSFKGSKSMEYLLEKLKEENLIDKSTYNGKIQYWKQFRKANSGINQLYNQVFPKK